MFVNNIQRGEMEGKRKTDFFALSSEKHGKRVKTRGILSRDVNLFYGFLQTNWSNVK